jgi:hypothetical protein
MSKTHEPKIWPVYFDAIERGDKTFEVRKNDRDFQAGDTLVLREYDPTKAFSPPPDAYTGRSLSRVVTYVLHGGQWGLQGDHVVLALKVPENTMDLSKIAESIARGAQRFSIQDGANGRECADPAAMIPKNAYWDNSSHTFRDSTGCTLPWTFTERWLDRRRDFPPMSTEGTM